MGMTSSHTGLYIDKSSNHIANLSCTAVFHDSPEMLSIDVGSLEGLFRSPHHSLRITSVYLLHTNCAPYRSLTPHRVFSLLHCPHLIVGDYNLHHPLAEHLHSLSDTEYTLSARYLNVAFTAPYQLLNTPEVYTRFPFDTITRPSLLDMAFANSTLSPFVSSWDSRRSTDKLHVPALPVLNHRQCPCEMV